MAGILNNGVHLFSVLTIPMARHAKRVAAGKSVLVLRDRRKRLPQLAQSVSQLENYATIVNGWKSIMTKWKAE